MSVERGTEVTCAQLGTKERVFGRVSSTQSSRYTTSVSGPEGGVLFFQLLFVGANRPFSYRLLCPLPPPWGGSEPNLRALLFVAGVASVTVVENHVLYILLYVLALSFLLPRGVTSECCFCFLFFFNTKKAL